MKIVKVVWEDAHTLNQTLSLKEVKEERNLISISIGYLIDENEERIAICGFCFPDLDNPPEDDNSNTGYRDTHFIPRKMIRKIIELIEKTPKIKKEELPTPETETPPVTLDFQKHGLGLLEKLEPEKAEAFPKAIKTESKTKMGRPPIDRENLRNEIISFLEKNPASQEKTIRSETGHSRNQIQGILNDMEKDGLIEFTRNTVGGGKMWILKSKKPKKIEELPKSYQYKKGTIKYKILDNLQDGKPKSYAEIAEDIGYGSHSVSSVLTTMKKDGTIYSENGKFRISGKPSKPKKGSPKPTVRSEKKEQRKQKILEAIKEDPGTHIDELASMLNMDKTTIRNITRESIESGEIFDVKGGHKNMLFPKGIDPKPYLPVEPKAKILEALQHGPKTKTELVIVTDITYPNLSDPIYKLMESGEIHGKRFKDRYGKKILYALKGVEIPIPETKPTKKDKEEERISEFLEDIIKILKGRELTLAQIAEEYLGKSIEEGGEEFRKFATNFGTAYHMGSIGKKKTEKGNVYFLEGGDQFIPEGSM